MLQKIAGNAEAAQARAITQLGHKTLEATTDEASSRKFPSLEGTFSQCTIDLTSDLCSAKDSCDLLVMGSWGGSDAGGSQYGGAGGSQYGGGYQPGGGYNTGGSGYIGADYGASAGGGAYSSGGYGAGGGNSGYGGGGYGAQKRDLDQISLHSENFTNLPAFEKNFYHEHPSVTARTPEEVDAYRARREIHVEGTGIPKPCTTFDEASFPGFSALMYGNSVSSAEQVTAPRLVSSLCLSVSPRQSVCFHAAVAKARARFFLTSTDTYVCLHSICPGGGEQSRLFRAHCNPGARVANGPFGARLDWPGRDWFGQDAGVCATCSRAHQCTALPW